MNKFIFIVAVLLLLFLHCSTFHKSIDNNDLITIKNILVDTYDEKGKVSVFVPPELAGVNAWGSFITVTMIDFDNATLAQAINQVLNDWSFEKELLQSVIYSLNEKCTNFNIISNEKLELKKETKKQIFQDPENIGTDPELLPDRQTVQLTAYGLDSTKSYNLVVLKVKDDAPFYNMMTGQVVSFRLASRLNFPIKINVGGEAIGDYLADQPWQPVLEYGRLDGYIENWLGYFEIENTAEDSIYLTGLHEAVKYKVRVPPGNYDVKLMLAENDASVQNNPRCFNIVVENHPIIDSLNIYEQVGLHTAYDVVAKEIEVVDGILDIHFTNLTNYSLLNGLVIEKKMIPA